MHLLNAMCGSSSTGSAHDYTMEHPISPSMHRFAYDLNERKRRNTSHNDQVRDPSDCWRTSDYQHQNHPSFGHYGMAGSRLEGSSESMAFTQHIKKNSYWQPYQPLPSPPQEEFPMTRLPSFSALSQSVVDNAAIFAHQPAAKSNVLLPRKTKSIDSLYNYPPTPALSVSSRSLSASCSSPLLQPLRAFLEPPVTAPASMPMYHFTGTNSDGKPRFPPRPMTGRSETEGPGSPPAAKRQCVEAPPQLSPLAFTPQTRQTTSPQPTYSLPRDVAQQPISFYTTTTNPIGFEHHHYIAPSSAAYPLPQERYNCPDCGRAFSRPSSLKIHTYSHTGEKPFYCPVRGCNKNFSVRSNMKRHERGCHARRKN